MNIIKYFKETFRSKSFWRAYCGGNPYPGFFFIVFFALWFCYSKGAEFNGYFTFFFIVYTILVYTLNSLAVISHIHNKQKAS